MSKYKKLSKGEKVERAYARKHSTASTIKSYGKQVGGPGLRRMPAQPQVVGVNPASTTTFQFNRHSNTRNTSGKVMTGKVTISNIRFVSTTNAGQQRRRRRRTAQVNPGFTVPFQTPRWR